MNQFVAQEGEVIRGKVQDNTPVDTGRLKGGWKRSRAVQGKAEIYNNVEYAAHVEYGHRTRGGKGFVKGSKMLSDRRIQVDITYIHPKDAMGRVSRTAVFEVADALDKVFRPVLAVKDRHITILDAEMTIVDDILHYIFNLDFRDNFEDAGRIQYELAQHLELEINKLNQTEGE